MIRPALLVLAAVLTAAAPAAALAWGATGHRIVGVAAARALPPELPAFLRTPDAAAALGELSREPDRSRDAGKVHDSDRDPGHFIDVDDQGRVLGGPLLAELPPTRADYETALRAAGTDAWKAGYLPYTIVDRQQQLIKDFAYWRVLKAAESNRAWRANRAWFAADRRRREALILQTLGALSHYVSDGSQPMHASVHHNGWGDYPNPMGFTMRKAHSQIEGAFVRETVTLDEVRAAMSDARGCRCRLEQRVAEYLAASEREVIPLYALEKAGGFSPGDPRGAAFVTRRLAAGASELRDLVVEAWRASAEAQVGWPSVAVRDVVAGRTDPFPSLYGID